MNTELFGNFTLKFLATKIAYLKNVSLCQLMIYMTFAAVVGAVNKPVLSIPGWRLPLQMFPRHTREATVAAGVRGLVLWRRRRAIFFFAYEPVDI